MTTTVSSTATSTAARVVDAVKIYGTGDTEVRALDGVSVDFPAGRFTAIMGPSGSGKSTLMHCAAGLDTLTSGSALIGDTALSALDDRRLTLLRRQRIGFVFQAFNLIPTLTVAENITLPMDLAGERGDQEWIDALIDTVGLRDRLHHRPGNSPGGSSNGSPWPAPSRDAPMSCSPTNRPAISTPDPARRCCGSSAAPSGRPAVRSSWSPTTRSPPPTPTRSSSSPTDASSTGCLIPPRSAYSTGSRPSTSHPARRR
ncbi:ABC transporter ATP-binding protein [Streptomyces sp. NPDC051664]|uniref:ABC transporter ATP-binding protein n=1 Tax=Streptomyces sp. NPDC051664 TaxID=3365668 RepID=UPI00378EB567